MKIPVTITTNDACVQQEHSSYEKEVFVSYRDTLKNASDDSSYSHEESSLYLPYDNALMALVKESVGEKIKNKLPKYVVVIGIGGSNLGTKAVYDALYGHYDVLDTKNERPKMLFLDTTDSVLMTKSLELLKKEVESQDDILIFIISKSGGTTETLVNAEILLDALMPSLPDIFSRTVVISDKDLALFVQANTQGITTLSIPSMVGGRYSVFTAASLAPLYACGVNVDLLVEGARDMEDVCLSLETHENPAFLSAQALFSNLKTGHTIHDTFIFVPALESLGKWYRQLLGESIGKEKNRDDKIVQIGITPTVSIGSTDLHSVGQLYLGGPRDKITTFLSLEHESIDMTLPQTLVFPGVLPMIHNKTTADVTRAILSGVKESYRAKGVPFISVVLDDVSERTLGAFFQWKMLEVMLLGKLLTVNPFDQPSVESYKIETKKILQG